MAAGLRAIAVSLLVGMSVALFIWQIGADWTYGFAHQNLLVLSTRVALLKAMVAGGIGLGLLGVFYTRFGERPAVERLERFARLVAPLILLGVLPAMLVRNAWEGWATGLALACFVLLFERLLRLSLRALDEMYERTAAGEAPSRRHERRIAAAIVFAAAIGYGAYMSKYTVYAHWRFQTYGYDLGQYDNVFWNALHGRPLRCTPLACFTNWSSLSGHADLSIFFLLPFYALYPHAEALLVMQSFILGLGAIPLYFFAARRLQPAYACAVALAYLLFPPTHGANFYDFHMQPIASTFVLLTICFLDRGRWFWCALSFAVAIGCREDISVGLTLLGLYLVFARYRSRAGAVIAVTGAAYFVAMRFFIMPKFGGSWFQEIYKDLYPQPDGPHTYGGVMLTLVTNPAYVFRTLLTEEKLRYFLQVATPVAFLPLRRAYLLPAFLPGVLFTLLTTGYAPTTDIGFQYSGHFTPYIFTASALAIAAYRSNGEAKVKMRAAAAAIVVGTLLCTTHWGAFPPHSMFKGGFYHVSFAKPTPADRQKARDLAELAAIVPENASVAVSEEELPHLSGRFDVRTLRDGTSGSDYLLHGNFSSGAAVAAKALLDGSYEEVTTRPGLALLKRKR